METPLTTLNYKTNLTFKDVYGMEDVKEKLVEIMDFLKGSERFERIGAKLRKGVLLYGPSGTGKTLFAKALAGECNANFIYSCAADFNDKYVGVGAKKIRRLFDQAERLNPCIIFIDEIDALGKRMRKNSEVDYAYQNEISNTINQLLTEMDGFKNRGKVVVIAATNNHLSLDTSLTRVGRFDLRVKTRLPSEEERLGILKLKLQSVQNKVTEKILKEIANLTQGLSGADLDALVNESSYIALRKKLEKVDDGCIKEALEFVRANEF